MKTLSEIESTCGRILSVLERDDLRGSTVETLSTMLVRLRADLEQELAARRAEVGDRPELRSADEALQAMTADVLWLKEYVKVKPLMECSQKVRMAGLRLLRVVALLQPVTSAVSTGPPLDRQVPVSRHVPR